MKKIMAKNIKFYFAIFLLFFWIVLAIIAPIVAPYDPQYVDLSLKLVSPNKTYLLGTDALGRDILSRIIYGARLSISISLSIQIILLLISVPVGLFVGWKQGKEESFFDWLTMVFSTFPSFLLAMVFVGMLGAGISNMIISVVVVEWIYYARILKNSVISQKQNEYVKYAILKGMPAGYILKKHIFPFVYGPILTASLMNIGNIILMISSFSFLGIGVQPNISEWGNMIHDNRTFFRNHPNLMLYPGIMILLAVGSFRFIASQIEEKFRGIK